MKKSAGFIFVLLALILFSFMIISAQDSPPGPPEPPDMPADSDIQKIQGATEQIPLNEQGEIDQTKVTELKSKAEQRIDAINEWLEKTDKYFLFIFKIPLRLNLEFTYLFFLVLISLSLFHNIPGWIGIDKEWVGILTGFGVTLILSYFEILKIIVEWIIKITNKWWLDLIILGILVIGLFVLVATSKTLKKWSEKRREKSDREKMHEGAEEAENIGRIGKALTEGLTKQ